VQLSPQTRMATGHTRRTLVKPMQLALCHLGYRPDSPKAITLCPSADHAHLPEHFPFYLRQNCFRMPRERV